MSQLVESHPSRPRTLRDRTPRDRTPRPRWQMTTRSRFAAVLGVASLGVAAVQLALLTGPPTPLQLLVLGFWTLVGGAYVASAFGQRLRERIVPRHRLEAGARRVSALVGSMRARRPGPRHRRVRPVTPAGPFEATGQTGPIALG